MKNIFTMPWRQLGLALCLFFAEWLTASPVYGQCNNPTIVPGSLEAVQATCGQYAYNRRLRMRLRNANQGWHKLFVNGSEVNSAGTGSPDANGDLPIEFTNLPLGQVNSLYIVDNSYGCQSATVNPATPLVFNDGPVVIPSSLEAVQIICGQNPAGRQLRLRLGNANDNSFRLFLNGNEVGTAWPSGINANGERSFTFTNLPVGQVNSLYVVDNSYGCQSATVVPAAPLVFDDGPSVVVNSLVAVQATCGQNASNRRLRLRLRNAYAGWGRLFVNGTEISGANVGPANANGERSVEFANLPLGQVNQLYVVQQDACPSPTITPPLPIVFDDRPVIVPGSLEVLQANCDQYSYSRRLRLRLRNANQAWFRLFVNGIEVNSAGAGTADANGERPIEFANLPLGQVSSLYVMDNSTGCQSVTVTPSPALRPYNDNPVIENITATRPGCGVSTTGSLTLQVYNGVVGGSYNVLNNGIPLGTAILTAQNTLVLNNLTSQIINGPVTINNGYGSCTSPAYPFTASLFPFDLTFTATPTTSCNQGGSLRVQVANGVAGRAYQATARDASGNALGSFSGNLSANLDLVIPNIPASTVTGVDFGEANCQAAYPCNFTFPAASLTLGTVTLRPPTCGQPGTLDVLTFGAINGRTYRFTMSGGSPSPITRDVVASSNAVAAGVMMPTYTFAVPDLPPGSSFSFIAVNELAGGCGDARSLSPSQAITVPTALVANSIYLWLGGSQTTLDHCVAGANIGVWANGPATGGWGTYTYAWQLFDAATNQWVNIPSGFSNEGGQVRASQPAGSYRYRRQVTSGGCTAFSNEVILNLHAPPNPVPGTEPTQTTLQVCGSAPVNIPVPTMQGGGGEANLHHEWFYQTSTMASWDWLPVSGATSAQLTAGYVAPQVAYRRRTTSRLPGCAGEGGATYTSPVITLQRYGSAPRNAWQLTCAGGSLTLKLRDFLGANDRTLPSDAAYQWEVATTTIDGPYANVAGATGAELVVNNVQGKAFYRRATTANGCTYKSEPFKVDLLSNVFIRIVASRTELCKPASFTLNLNDPERFPKEDFEFLWEYVRSGPGYGWRNLMELGPNVTYLPQIVVNGLQWTSSFRAKVRRRGCTVWTDAITPININVLGELTAGRVRTGATPPAPGTLLPRPPRRIHPGQPLVTAVLSHVDGTNTATGGTLSYTWQRERRRLYGNTYGSSGWVAVRGLGSSLDGYATDVIVSGRQLQVFDRGYNADFDDPRPASPGQDNHLIVLRRVANGTGACAGEVFSNEVSLSLIAAGRIAAPTGQVCVNSVATFAQASPAFWANGADNETGDPGNFEYILQSAPAPVDGSVGMDHPSWTTEGGISRSPVLTSAPIAAGPRQFRRGVREVGSGSGWAFTYPIVINPVASPLTPGMINAPSQPCANASVTLSATGGGTTSTDWESSVDGVIWVRSGLGGDLFTTIPNHRFYRRRAELGNNCPVYTNTVQVVPLTAGEAVQGLALVCAAQPGTLPFPSVSLAQANPGTTVSYRWWWRTNAPNSNWTQLAQGTNLASFNHNPTNIPADATELQYRRDAVVGTCVVLGNPMRVGLMRNGTDNTPMPPLNPVCAGEALAINLGNNQGGVTYQWQTSPSGLADTWQEVPGATNASLITTATATAYYRRRSTLAGCTNVFTAPVRVLVTPRATVKIEQEYHYDANRQVLVGVTLVARGADSYTWTMNGTAYPGPFTINFADFAGVRIFRATAVVAGSPCPGAWAEVALEGTKNDCGPTRENRNYVRATTVRIEGVTNPATVPALKQTWGEVNVATTYLDGLGRPIQAVAHHASPGYRDVVAPVVYDEYGRSPRAFMPYTVANPNPCQRYRPNAVNSTGANRYAEGTDYQNSEQAGFYNERFNGEEWRFFSQTDFEASPLDRALRVAAPGADWALTSSYNPVSGPALTDRSVKAVGRPNATTDNVYWFRFNLDAANRPYWSALGSTYPTGELWVTELIDEHNKRTWEFTDKEGRTVLKRTRAEESNQASETNQGQFADTYFIYNDLSQLVATIQPEGVRALAANPGFFADDTPDPNRDRFIFLYRYDARGRVVEKKVPGKGWEFVVYNRRDQVAMTQDAQQRATQQWSFTKYDPLGRPVLTGTLTDGATRSDFQAALNAAHLPLFDTYSPTGLRFGYSDTSFPFAGVAKEVNMVSYYDNYTLPNALPTTTGTGAPALVQPGAAGLESLPLGYRGSPTVGYERILGTNTFTRTVTYYDKYHRAAQMRHRNHAGGDDLTSTRYDFEGKVLETRTTHQRNANSPRQVVTLRPEYDHQGRTLRTYQQVATADPTGANLVEQPTVLLAELTYNELGQMASQRLHSTDEGRNWLQDVAYRYHLRGWLTHVNDLATVNNQKLFAYELRYNRLGEGLDPAAEAQHNGGIAATLWRTATATGQQARSYAYTYDAMGRLKKAHYRNLADPASPERFGLGGAAGTNLEAGIQYDLNGNILNLWREGAVGRTTANGTVGYTYGSRSGTPLDRLAYSYDGNMLLRVRDTGLRDVATQTGTGDFRNRGQQPTDQGTDYIYDANGSLTADVNKGATQVTYNHLGLATKVCFGAGCANFIEYTYDASGQKLTKRVTEGGTSRLTEYHGAFTYEAAPGQTTPQLAFMAMPGGRIIAPLSSGEGPGVGPFGDPTTYEYHYRDHLGNLRLAYRPQGTRQAALRLTAEAANEANEGNNFTFASNQVDGTRGYRSARSLQLNQTKGTVSLKPTNAQVRAGQAVRVSVRATYDAEDPFQLLGRPAPSTPEAVPANRLTLSTPVLVLPGGLPPGEVVNRPPPQLNLLGLARAVGGLIFKPSPTPSPTFVSPSPMPVSPQASRGPGDLTSTAPAPPAAKLVVRVVDGQGNVRHRQEQAISHRAATAWEELAIGLTAPVDGRLEVWVENASIVNAWFDDLTVERADVPTALVVQEAHYDPWGLELAPLGMSLPNPGRELFNGGSERERGLSSLTDIHWDEPSWNRRRSGPMMRSWAGSTGWTYWPTCSPASPRCTLGTTTP